MLGLRSCAEPRGGGRSQDLTPNTQDLKTQRYNNPVPSPEPNDSRQERKHRRHAVYASEATGLLLIAFVLLVLTLVRYWQNMNWSLR